MTKKLLPKEVTKIAVHKDVLNNLKCLAEFIDDNKITDIYRLSSEDVLDVIDMRNKIVVKCCYIDESLKEDQVYDLLISQNMKDGITLEEKVYSRERLSMKLSKVEIPSGANTQIVTYVFEKNESKNEFKINYDNLKKENESINRIMDTVIEKLKKDLIINQR